VEGAEGAGAGDATDGREARREAARAQQEQDQLARERLIDRNLADLEAAADRAERAGDPAYAARLRQRAEALEQRAQAD
jgi:hypothetical protein